jgi:hypothetical protein
MIMEVAGKLLYGRGRLAKSQDGNRELLENEAVAWVYTYTKRLGYKRTLVAATVSVSVSGRILDQQKT